MFDLHATSLIVNLLAFGGTTGHMRVSHAGNTYSGGDIFLKAYERKMAPRGATIKYASQPGCSTHMTSSRCHSSCRAQDNKYPGCL